MSYQDRFARALKLKDFVSLYEDKANIYLVFTNDTDFEVKTFGQDMDDGAKIRITHEPIHVTKLPIAFFYWSKIEEANVYSYYDPSFYFHINLSSNTMIYFSDRSSLSLEVLRQEALGSYNELVTKLK